MARNATHDRFGHILLSIRLLNVYSNGCYGLCGQQSVVVIDTEHANIEVRS